MLNLSTVSMRAVKAEYDERVAINQQLLGYLRTGMAKEYAELAVGFSSPSGNRLATNYGLAKDILEANWPDSLHKLGMALFTCAPSEIYSVITTDPLPMVDGDICIEMAMMLRPQEIWPISAEIVWACALVDSALEELTANQKLSEFMAGAATAGSGSDFLFDQHRELQAPVNALAKKGKEEAVRQEVRPGLITYLWADSFARELYRKKSLE